MLMKWKVPKTIQWVVKLFVIFLAIFSLFRVATFFAFAPDDVSFFAALPCFGLGVLFDIRWICIILSPILLLSFIPHLTPFRSDRNKKWWTTYLAIITFLIFIFFGADFGSFSYDSTRLNAIALNFVDDAKISMQMIWQTYPVFWIALGIAVAIWFFRWLFHQTHTKVEVVNSVDEINYMRNWYGAALLLMILGIYGSITAKPLKWNDAFMFKDNFRSYLALNPLQNFFTTLRFRKPYHDLEKALEYYPVMKDYLKIAPKAKGYVRQIEPGVDALESKPNIVLVVCESFSMYKSTMSGNPLNTTPYFDELTKKGIFFNRCFSPSFGTARGLFALLTGTPDVQVAKFSTQNQEALKQRTIINDFKGYDKHYFLGGSSEFNNFKGLLGNIKGLTIYEENSFNSPKVNVWGISDKNLFLESDKILRQQTKPFFAIIQTANNHRPYTIPEEDTDFIKDQIPQDTLVKYGFLSADEYYAFKYMDYSIKHFMETARQSPYFDNTIFVFVGDHGVAGNATSMYPQAWTEQRLTAEHIPLLLYAPKLLVPKTVTYPVSQLDVLPTIAGLTNIHYQNTTIGRDVLKQGLHRSAFIIHHDEGKIGLVTDDYYFIKNFRFEQELMYPISPRFDSYNSLQLDSMRKKSSAITSAIYETAKWMLVNNKE
jgi:phosphoglycerol transferase MdoB-like AlkP superfamily enzyme